MFRIAARIHQRSLQPMKLHHLIRVICAVSIGLLAAGCFYSSQPVESSLGTNCKSQTMGLMFLSRPDVTCEQSAQPPAPDVPPGSGQPMSGGPGSAPSTPSQ
jgi:hypothetical protein